MTFLEAIQPFVRIKRDQVDHGLAFLRLPPKRCRYEKRKGSWPLKIPHAEDVAIREAMKRKMNELNLRGPTVVVG